MKVPLTIRTQGGAGWSPGRAARAAARVVVRARARASRSSSRRRPRTCAACSGRSIYDDNPVIFFEHRTLYPLKGEVPDELEPIPLGKARVHREGADVTVVATGRLVPRGAAGGGGGREGGDLGRGRRPADAAPARRGDDRRLGEEDDALRHRARGGHARRLRRRARGRDPARRLRLPRRADRARRREVRAARRSRRRWSSGSSRTPPTCSRRSGGRWRGA